MRTGHRTHAYTFYLVAHGQRKALVCGVDLRMVEPPWQCGVAGCWITSEACSVGGHGAKAWHTMVMSLLTLVSVP